MGADTLFGTGNVSFCTATDARSRQAQLVAGATRRTDGPLNPHTFDVDHGPLGGSGGSRPKEELKAMTEFKYELASDCSVRVRKGDEHVI
jgi:hypothetical protein